MPTPTTSKRETVVLNALRHQRFDHPSGIAVALAPLACSTPYGIRGLITRLEIDWHVITPYVLNALRHQRFDHTAISFLIEPVPGSAQRLTASEV